ncbi:MAG: glycoside hydrolase family 20 zincin-like fold domain-containing protein, partial [Mucilaginibacter sp.]
MYKKLILPLFSLLFLVSITVDAQDNDPNMGIIPAPALVKKASGEFVLSQQTLLFADSANNKAVGFFTDYLREKLNLRNQLKIGDAGNAANSIVLTAKGTENLPDQGYRLTITPQQIIIAGKGAGLFYGIQTLLQLIPADHKASI